MGNVSRLITAASVGFVAGILLLVGGFVDGALQWFPAHGAVMLVGTLLPALAALHVVSLDRLAGVSLPSPVVRHATAGLLVGALLLGVGHLLQPSGLFAGLAFAGLVVAALAMTRLALVVLSAVPRHATDPETPITKGDDASWKHVRFAHIFLLLGLLLLLIAYAPGAVTVSWLAGVRAAGIHVLLVGYGLLSVYGLGHLWVPRLSGVPAIAVGAIKGELHSTLLGLVGLIIGFLTGIQGFLVGLGPFVFLGFFTYMGVLGANIMRNKSKTQRVTPEFVYVPWVFSAVFWLISGVLMGIFLNVVPDALAHLQGSLRWLHVHVALLGGVLQLLLGLATRIASDPPPHFQGAMKGAFYGFNGGLVVAGAGHLAAGPQSPAVLVGAAMVLLSLLLFVQAMGGFFRGSSSARRS